MLDRNYRLPSQSIPMPFYSRLAETAPRRKCLGKMDNRVSTHWIALTFRPQPIVSVCEALGNRHNYSTHTHSCYPMQSPLHTPHQIPHACPSRYKHHPSCCIVASKGACGPHVLYPAPTPSTCEPLYSACYPYNHAR